MEVIPAVDIQDGACVQLVGGDPDTSETYGDPVAVARDWEAADAKRLHVIDLDAALGSGENRALVTAIIDAVDIPVQVGGGIRDVETGLALIDAGADRIILGTAAIKAPAVVEELIETVGGECLLIALDTAKGSVTIEGWTESVTGDWLDLARHFDETGVGGFLFTNVDREGRQGGIDPQPIRRLVDAVDAEVIAAGGVADADDVDRARDAGADGLVIGTALYAGGLSLSEAMERVR